MCTRPHGYKYTLVIIRYVYTRVTHATCVRASARLETHAGYTLRVQAYHPRSVRVSARLETHAGYHTLRVQTYHPRSVRASARLETHAGYHTLRVHTCHPRNVCARLCDCNPKSFPPSHLPRGSLPGDGTPWDRGPARWDPELAPGLPS